MPRKRSNSCLLDSIHNITLDALGRLNYIVLRLLQGLLRALALDAHVVAHDTSDLDDADDAEEEVYRCESSGNERQCRFSRGVIVLVLKTRG